MDKEFYCGRRVFVTGHLGFKGEWLARGLLGLGASVTGYSLYPSHASVRPSPILTQGLSNHLGDVLDYEGLCSSLGQSDAEVVFHLAAQPLVSVGHADPRATFLSNVMGTVNVLHAVETVPSVRCVIVVTSDKVYRPRHDRIPHHETDELGGNDAYSASKACAELVTRTYAHRYLRLGRVAVATARAGNVIGGADWSRDRLVPDLARALGAGGRITLRRPSATRPWQHVTDPVRGYLMLASYLYRHIEKSGGAWNFGPTVGHVRTVRQVAERFFSAWGRQSDGSIDFVADPLIPETDALAICSDRASKTLGWTPKHDADRAVDLAADWYRAFYGGIDHDAVMNAQLVEGMAQLGIE